MAEGIHNYNNQQQNIPNQDYGAQFKQWWSVARQLEEPPTPYDFLVNFGLSPTLVQVFFWDILDHFCKSPSPGILDYFISSLFFTDEVRHASFKVWKEEKKYYIEHCEYFLFEMMVDAIECGPSTEKITFQDLKSLGDLLIQSRRHLPLGGRRDDRTEWDAAVKSCMYLKYSSEVIQYMFDQMDLPMSDHAFNRYKLPIFPIFTADNPNHRPAMDHDCLSGLQRILPKICDLTVPYIAWTETAFVDFMAILGKTSQLKKLWIKVPDTFQGEPTSSSSLSIIVQDHTHQGHQALGGCGIEDLQLDFPTGSYKSVLCGHEAVLQLLPCCTNLKRLIVDLASIPHKAGTPYILQAIQNANALHDLRLEIYSGDDDQSDVPTIFDQVKNSSSITTFDYHELNRNKKFYHLYGNKAVEVVEQNTKLIGLHYLHQPLSSACVDGDDDDDDDDDKEEGKPPTGRPEWSEKIHYYMELNQIGRTIARDSNTTMVDFVALLCSGDLEQYAISPTHFLSMFYTLLREAPGNWSAEAVKEKRRNNRKRKADDDQSLDS